MQSRPAVFMSARLVVASCAEMAAEADIGHYMQHAINTTHYRDTPVVLGNESKTQRHWFIALCELRIIKEKKIITHVPNFAIISLSANE